MNCLSLFRISRPLISAFGPELSSRCFASGKGIRRKRFYENIRIKSKPKRKRDLSVRAKRKTIYRRTEAFLEHEQKAEEEKLPWRIKVAVLVERLPLLYKEREPWEVEYESMRERMMLEEEEKYPIRSKLVPPPLVGDPEELMKMLPFTPASRTTEADETGDRSTLNRKLDTELFLLVRRSKGDAFKFPTGNLHTGESLIEGTKRIVQEQLGPKLESYFITNAPCGWDWSLYSEDSQEKYKHYGIKFFYMRVLHVSGAPMKPPGEDVDFLWVTKEEAREYFPEDSYAYIRQLL